MYQNKYFKYKNKYLHLKKQLAGAHAEPTSPSRYLPSYSIANIFSHLSIQDAISTFENLIQNPDRNYRIKLYDSFYSYLAQIDEFIDQDFINTPFFNNINPSRKRFRDAIRKLKNVSTLTNLPINLTHLTFSNDFNQPINENVLPNKLTHLIFGYQFNQPILPGVLSNLNNLTNLTFGSNFNQSLLPSVFPISLTNLTFGYNFNQPLQSGVLPNTLQYIGVENKQIFLNLLSDTDKERFKDKIFNLMKTITFY